MVVSEHISTELRLLVRLKLKMTYSLVDGPEEVDLILESISPGFKFHLVHVGSINILERTGCAKEELLEQDSTSMHGFIYYFTEI